MQRISQFASDWCREQGNTEIIIFSKEERLVARHTAGTLFAIYGMGMPSASIAVHGLMRMLYFLCIQVDGRFGTEMHL
ncbi:hypothetical protein [Desulfatirhabdium butyrativorans]|uniref:hypothetical protein n=1 Tax=Desulfatirhabdium butyrativorans TaxID=340467 RepID=UPI0003F834D2|nr:hypothetical protein [Desulfatirhabdium butyrativorans]